MRPPKFFAFDFRGALLEIIISMQMGNKYGLSMEGAERGHLSTDKAVKTGDHCFSRTLTREHGKVLWGKAFA
ncbi:MAG: hypothetical protein JO266_03540 [Acidobacteria bacterium]|nr:hypothetical protein [Acidobacteriota bacterium]